MVLKYMNTVHSASDNVDFLQFFDEAGNVANIEVSDFVKLSESG